MSVITTADKKREEARDLLSKMIVLLSDVVISRDWGYDDYKDSYKTELRRILFELMDISDRL